MNNGTSKPNPELALSVILPVYNEEENIIHLHNEIVAVLDAMPGQSEIVYVDDGSSDGTLDCLKEIHESDERAVVVEFRRNFGQTAAMAAGFDMARGEIVIAMDADRQNDPADIPKLVAKIEEGFDLVSGWRHDRKDGYWLRLFPSKIANKLISSTTDVRLHDYGCSLKAFRFEVAKQLSLYGEMHRFIPALASAVGVRIAEVKVNHRPRVAGESKYGISRTFRVILDLITVKFLLRFSSKPMQFFGSIGLISGFIGFALCFYLTIEKLFYSVPMSDRPLLLLGIMLLFIGLQFITVGLLAELMTRTYHEAQDKPIYTVRNILRKK
ncbi:MAG: glycosyltransferase family 2 protein [Acidiferrobacterales bacterium]|nr:glycosyltransferase family 2 protein [Acidiferrobacterales bacterium]